MSEFSQTEGPTWSGADGTRANPRRMKKAAAGLVDKAAILSGVIEGRLTDELAAAMGIAPSVWEPSFDELLEIVRDRFRQPTA